MGVRGRAAMLGRGPFVLRSTLLYGSVNQMRYLLYSGSFARLNLFLHGKLMPVEGP